MTEAEESKRIATLLQQDAPPARDPLFRIGVFERRERERFRQRSLLLLAVTLALAILSVVVIVVGGETMRTTGVLVVMCGLGAAYVFYRPLITRILQRFQR